jgi:putative IMPACT (imprinted ancient) family translation regulator
MPEFSYITIKSGVQGLYKEKGSKFLAFAYPVESEEEVKQRLLELRKAYYDARHHCYAYVLGAEKEKYRATDDGEPNHSAGDPILGQIRSRNLTNVLVVVVRYFGGVKLGVGGLV